MPTISMFYGIIIRMYCAPSEHNPPHIHIYYNEYVAILDLNSLEFTSGKLPNKQRKLVEAWTRWTYGRLEFGSKWWVTIFDWPIKIGGWYVFGSKRCETTRWL